MNAFVLDFDPETIKVLLRIPNLDWEVWCNPFMSYAIFIFSFLSKQIFHYEGHQSKVFVKFIKGFDSTLQRRHDIFEVGNLKLK